MASGQRSWPQVLLSNAFSALTLGRMPDENGDAHNGGEDELMRDAEGQQQQQQQQQQEADGDQQQQFQQPQPVNNRSSIDLKEKLLRQTPEFTGIGSKESCTANWEQWKYKVSHTAEYFGMTLDEQTQYNLALQKLDGKIARAVQQRILEGEIWCWSSLDRFMESGQFTALSNPLTERQPFYQQIPGRIRTGKRYKQIVQQMQQELTAAADSEKICLCLAALDEGLRKEVVVDPNTSKFPTSWADFATYSTTKLADMSVPGSSSNGGGNNGSRGGSSTPRSSSGKGRRSFDSSISGDGKRHKGAGSSHSNGGKKCPACGGTDHVHPLSYKGSKYVCPKYDAKKNPAGKKVEGN